MRIGCDDWMCLFVKVNLEYRLLHNSLPEVLEQSKRFITDQCVGYFGSFEKSYEGRDEKEWDGESETVDEGQ
jgi:hypothetical protein